MASSGEKWVLWLKSVTITLIFVVLLFEVLIVSNEARKIMNEDSIRVCCVDGAFKMSCGEKAIQLGPSAADLQKSLRFAARKLAVLILPFNLMSLTAKLFL